MRLFLSDARYALRRMARSPGFTAVAVLTLALGIGVNTAIFSLIDTVLLRPLPFDEPDRLVRVWAAQPKDGRRFLEATFPEVEALREHNRVFVKTAAFSVAPRDLHDAAASPSKIVIARVSAGFFDVVGVDPWIGRDFTDVEYRGGAPAVILGYGLWQSRYGGRVDVLGERIFIQGEPHVVVGVLPRSYHFPHQAVLWRPFTADENQDDDRELQVLARLRPGVGLEQASADVALVFSRREAASAEGLTGWVQPLHAMLVRDVRTPFWILLAAVGAVLAIACANVANLQLARGTARRRELAIRTALGAGRRRLIHQVLTENLALAAFGGAAGLMLGSWLVRAVVRISPVDLPRLMEVELDVRVAAVMLAVTFVAGLFCGSIPAFQAARGEPASVLHGAHGGVAGSGMRLQQLFVVAQVALATLLAVGAGLLGSTFLQLFHAERGFATESVMVVGLSPPASRDTAEGRIAFYEQMERALAELPGVDAAALTSFHPMQVDGFHMPFEIVGRAAASDDRRALTSSVTPGFFRAAGIAMRAGRPLEAADTHGVAVVNEAFVRAFLGGAEPLGTSFTHPAYFGDERPSEHEIVGVVADVNADVSAAGPRPKIYLPYRQLPWPRMKVLLSFAGDPAALAAAARARVWEIDATIPVDDFATMEQLIVRSVASQRFNMRLVGAFAVLALLLAALGIYGVVSCSVARRTREFGLRVALGADWRSIAALVLGRGLTLSLAGVALGLLAAAGATRFLASLLFGVRPLEPWLLAAVAVGLAAVAVASSSLPALRALRVEPVTALRVD